MKSSDIDDSVRAWLEGRTRSAEWSELPQSDRLVDFTVRLPDTTLRVIQAIAGEKDVGEMLRERIEKRAVSVALSHRASIIFDRRRYRLYYLRTRHRRKTLARLEELRDRWIKENEDPPHVAFGVAWLSTKMAWSWHHYKHSLKPDQFNINVHYVPEMFPKALVAELEAMGAELKWDDLLSEPVRWER